MVVHVVQQRIIPKLSESVQRGSLTLCLRRHTVRALTGQIVGIRPQISSANGDHHMTRQLRVGVLSGLFLLSSLAMVHSARAQNTAGGNAPPPQASVQSQRPDPAPERQSDQVTNIPYFTLRDGMSSTLTLNNNAPSPTPVKE